MRTRAHVSRLVNTLALILLAVAAIGIPVGYALTFYSSILTALETEAEINARLITDIINSNPTMWEYEQVRIEEILSRRLKGGIPEARRVYNLGGEQVAESADGLAPPVVARSAALFDSGAVIGRIEISRSLRPLLVRTALLLLTAILLAGAAYAVLLAAPLRLISEKETALHKSEEKYRRLIEASADAIIVFDRTTDVILEANQRALAMFGMSVELVIGMPHSAVYPLADAARFRELVLRSAEKEAIIADGVFVVSARGGRTEVEVSASIAELDGRDVVQARFTDITHRRQMEQRLVRAERMAALGVLAAGIAHQFNNINAATLGYLHILEGESGVSASAKEYLAAARAAIQRAVAITSQLTLLSPQSMAHAPSVPAGEAVRQVVPSLLPGLEREGVSLTVELEDTRPVAIARTQLDFILNALIENARHALLGRPERAIRIETADSNGETRVRVSDTGMGIAPEMQKNLFTPFFTMKGEHAPPGSPQMKVKGVGLSLAVTYAIVSGGGGRVQVESDGRTGTAFTLWLPAHAPAAFERAPA